MQARECGGFKSAENCGGREKTLEESVSVGDNDASSVEKRGTACAARCGRDWKDEDRKKESLISSSSKILKCYHCGKAGHVARNCPESALFSESGRKDRIRERNVTREGTVEGTKVQDILLDTGCSRTMIRKGLVPPSKWLPDQAVTIRCAHGDTMVYPLALVELNVEGIPVHGSGGSTFGYVASSSTARS